MTLIEVLVALAIIGVAFGVLALTQVMTMKVGTDSRNASDATDYANSMLEAQAQAVRADFGNLLSLCQTVGGGALCSDDIDDGRFQGQVIWGKDGTGYLQEGLIRVSVELTEPSSVAFMRVISCMDVNPAPSVAVPDPCPEKPEP